MGPEPTQEWGCYSTWSISSKMGGRKPSESTGGGHIRGGTWRVGSVPSPSLAPALEEGGLGERGLLIWVADTQVGPCVIWPYSRRL